LVTAKTSRLRAFLAEHRDIVVKPLDAMGGQSIFRVRKGDQNTTVILETMTEGDQSAVMAQRYIPEISEGDKRLLLINGDPVPYALARIPAKGELRGNLAAGGAGVGQKLTARDTEIAAKVGPVLKKMGIVFAGLDVIGDYLTEINVTSPTCIRELEAQYDINISDQLIDCITDLLGK
jgi:glutathione synthase